ncbi:MAG: hypothetical protein ABW298_01860 [Candidatus Binatia bacterium]
MADEKVDGPRPRLRRAEAALVTGAGLLLAVVYTYPLVRHFTSAIPYACGVTPERRIQSLVPGDPLQFLYYLSLTDDMVRGRIPWFRDPYQFSVPEPSTPRSFFFLPFSLLFAAVAPFGRATAYNVLVLLSFPATALAGYLLALRLGASRTGAAMSAATLTLLPYRIANVAGGHPTGIAFFLLPLAYYFLEVAWQERRAGAGLVAGICAACLAVNEPHFFYFFVLLLPLWVLFAAWRLEPTRPVSWSAGLLGWLALAAVGPASAAAAYAVRHGADWAMALGSSLLAGGLVVAAWRVTSEIRARAGGEWWLAEARSYWPLVLLAVYPVQLALEVPRLGSLLIAGAGAATLMGKLPALPAVTGMTRREHSRLAAIAPVTIGVLLGSALLLHYKTRFIDRSSHAAGRSMREIRLFAPHASDFLDRSSTILSNQLYPGAAATALALAALATRDGRALWAVGIAFGAMALGPNAPSWLPLYSASRRFVPFFGIIRQPAKLFAVAAVAIALAAALGATVVGRRLGARGRVAFTCAALAAILADFASLLPFGLSVLPDRNRAYAELAARAHGTNLLELPLWPGDSAYSSIYQYWATKTRVPIVNGYSATAPRDYVERVSRPLDSMNLGELTEAQNRLLEELRVWFITLHRDSYPPQVSMYPYRFALAVMRENPNLRPVAADGGVYLFERTGGTFQRWTPSVRWLPNVFYEAENLKIGAGAAIEDDDASARIAVEGRAADRPLIYGPYRPLPLGSYEARFRARGGGRVEVVTDLGRTELGTAKVDGESWREIPVAFALDRPRTIEFRAWGRRSADPPLDVDWVLLHRLSPGEGEDRGVERFEAEDLTALHGFEGDSADASADGYAVVADDVPGAVVRDGPYFLAPPGRWRAALRSRRGPFRVRIESADGRRRLADVAIGASAEWTIQRTEFEVSERMPLCTRIVSTGHQADVDYVDLSPVGREAASP